MEQGIKESELVLISLPELVMTSLNKLAGYCIILFTACQEVIMSHLPG